MTEGDTTEQEGVTPYSWEAHVEINRYPEITEDAQTVPAHIRSYVESYKINKKHQPALVQGEKTWTYEEYLTSIEQTAYSFIKLGLDPLKGVGIIGFNSPEWFFSFYGSMFAGGYAVGIYSTNSASAVAYVINDSECQIVVTQDVKQTEKILAKAEELPNLKAVVQYEQSVDEIRAQKGDSLPFKLMTWMEMLDQYCAGYTPQPAEVIEREKNLSPYKCCDVVYTSGTTGFPKGAMLSHANYVSMVKSIIRSGKRCYERFDCMVLVSYLPLSHIMAQITDIGTTFGLGGTLVFAKPDALKGSLSETIALHRPHVLIGVPRVYEKMQASIEKILMQQNGLARWAISKCLDKVLLANECAMQGLPEPWGSYAARRIVQEIKSRAGMDRIVYALSGGAPLLEDTQKFWLKLDIPICQGYGLSEVTGAHVAQYPLTNASDWLDYTVGSNGITIDGRYKVRMDPATDEILLAGQNVFSGYLHKEEATKECFTQIEGEWYFRTGDQGKFDKNGGLLITGRLKELIVTAGGENVPPVPIEESIKRNCEDLLSNVIVVGDKRKFLSCFVTLKCNFETRDDGQEWPTDELTSWTVKSLERAGIQGITKVSEAKKNDAVRKLIEDAIKKYNKNDATASAQCVQKFEILDQDLSIPAGDLGPTLKLKRNVVGEKLKPEIDKFYPED